MVFSKCLSSTAAAPVSPCASGVISMRRSLHVGASRRTAAGKGRAGESWDRVGAVVGESPCHHPTTLKTSSLPQSLFSPPSRPSSLAFSPQSPALSAPSSAYILLSRSFHTSSHRASDPPKRNPPPIGSAPSPSLSTSPPASPAEPTTPQPSGTLPPSADSLITITTSSTPPTSSPSTSLKPSLSQRIQTFRKLIAPAKDTTSSIRKLVALAKPEKKTIWTAVGLLTISSVISASVPMTIGKLIDFFSTEENSTFFGMTFPVAASVLTLAFVLGALANTGRAILMRLAGQRIIARVRNRSYVNVLRQEVEYADKGTGDILSRLGSDTTIVGESVTSNLSDGLRAVISASVGITAMVFISPKLTALMLAVVPPLSLAAVFYGRYLRTLSKQTQDALGDMTKVAEEKLSAFRTLTAFNSQPTEAKAFSGKVDRVFQLARKEAIASGIFFGGTGLTGNLTMLCLLGYGGHLVSVGEISVGSLTSLLIYTGYVGGSVSGLTGFFTGLMKGVGAGSRVFELLDRQPAIPTTTGVPLSRSRNGDIRLENVSFAYPSRPGVPVLTNVDINIEMGTSVAIVGPSGSGKSSVHGLLLRYYDPDAGRITFDGQDIREFTSESWRNKLGIVPQDPPLFNGTILDNITYGTPNATLEEVEKAARQANCDFIWTLPDGLQTQVGKASLSGGQRQRIAIARALVRNPTVLLLDEATSALDSGAEHQVNQAITQILEQRSITVILVAHRLSSIARARKIIVVEDGKITEEGLYSELSVTEGSRFRQLMAAQLALEGNNNASSSRRQQQQELSPSPSSSPAPEEKGDQSNAVGAGLEQLGEEVESGKKAASL